MERTGAHLLLLLAAAASVPMAAAGDGCDYQEVLTGRDIIDRGVVERSADCLDSFLELVMTPAANYTGESVSLSISDMEGDLYTFTDADPFTEVLTIATRGPYVYFQGSGAWDIELEVFEVPRAECYEEEPLTGNVSLAVPSGKDGDGECGGPVQPNSRWSYDFQGDRRMQVLDLSFDLGKPSEAFLALTAPNGRVAIVTGRSDQFKETRVAAATPRGRLRLDVITQNTLSDTSGFSVEGRAYVGEGEVTTAPTTSTEVTVEPPGDAVDVYVLVVDEGTYEDWLYDLQDEIVALADEYVNSPLSNCTFVFSLARTCRQRCAMTTSTERGCVYFSASVETTTSCSYTNELLRKDLTSDDSTLEELADIAEADRIEIDECLDTVEWGWMVFVIGIPVVTALVFVAGYAVFSLMESSRRKAGKKRLRTESIQSLGKRSRRATMEGGSRSFSGGAPGSSEGGGTYRSPPSYFDNNLELVDD